MRGRLGLLSTAALCVAALAAYAATAEVGEEAPELDLTSWVQGEPLKLKDCVDKKVVALEFWASDSEPCKKAIPRFSRLYEKQKDHDFEAIAISEQSPEVVKAFAADGKFKCRVACDGDRNTSGPYGARIKTIPLGVVVDKKGILVWKGPADKLDRIVAMVLAGKYDADKAKKIAEAQSAVDDAVDGKSWDEAAQAAEKLFALDAGNDHAITAKLGQCKANKDAKAAREFVEKLLPTIDDDPTALNVLAWTLVKTDSDALKLPALSLKAARRAVALTEGHDAAMLDTLARIEQSLGDLDAAIATQKKALAAEGPDEGMQATLDYYLACADAKKSGDK